MILLSSKVNISIITKTYNKNNYNKKNNSKIQLMNISQTKRHLNIFYTPTFLYLKENIIVMP